ncbi:Arginine transport ATP-binding protein ArtM [Paraburkholderia ribeironis]|uniref:Arginine transport ATP-binding protein ArtM n=1 Tax=Paraburkholderia ribeironis TaxID=1247936 RepID=A0A1N7RT89_9BURK|nr:amino acid ABC transporter ATP-binding protein [Paraburkholderia ribeironis]SIT38335.1 Arginine transport ATP-binding protein ArtM [Paraburkholderia ribeironis]
MENVAVEQLTPAVRQTESIIKADGVSLSFGDVKALEDVSINVGQSEVVTIVGPSGAGKSTFLRCLNLLTTPDRGHIAIEGKLIFNDALMLNKRDLRDVRRKLGMVFQRFHLFPHLTALENVTLAMLDAGIATRDEAVETATGLLERVGLLKRALAPAPRLSGGEQQRVAIARALAMRPRALLFDEPTSALDPEASREVLSVMKELAQQGTTMVVVTHEMKFALNVSDRILFMEAGKAIETGTSQDMFYRAKSPRARAFFAQALDHMDT